MFLVFYKRIIKINYGVKRNKIYTITDITGSSDFSKNLTKIPNSYVSVLQGGNLLFTFIEMDKRRKKGNNLKVKNLYMRRKIENEFKSSFLY